MATRNILTKEEPTLYKTSRPVKVFDARLHQLLDDMAETLLQSGGVGLAARAEGCLSFPDEYGIVTRPMEVTVRAQDRYGKEFTVSGTGLTARCFCHEIDHLDGVVFTSLCERMLTQEELENGKIEE